MNECSLFLARQSLHDHFVWRPSRLLLITHEHHLEQNGKANVNTSLTRQILSWHTKTCRTGLIFLPRLRCFLFRRRIDRENVRAKATRHAADRARKTLRSANSFVTVGDKVGEVH